jgi:tRNA-dihydrouridine synthase B
MSKHLNDDLCLAPLRGVTGRAFRATFARHFGGVDRSVAPFIPTVAGDRIKPALLTELSPDGNTAMRLVPQVIGKDPAQLRTMLAAMRALGYEQVDLNAGCPWPMVVRRGRGCGLMRQADAFARMLEAGCESLPGGFSVKVRLGVDDPELLAARMAVINAHPLREVTIHARTARQMYEGHVDLARFGQCLALCRHPVVYNGDIRSAHDLARLRQAFPQVSRWMIGRGLAADPFLAEILRGRTVSRDILRLQAFLDDLLAASVVELHGDRQVMGRFKELWGYLGPSLHGGRLLLRRIQLCATVDEYRRSVKDWFSHAPAWGAEQDGLPDALFAACKVSAAGKVFAAGKPGGESR